MPVQFNVTLGDLLVVISILLGVWKLGRRIWEHDILWLHHASRMGLAPTAPSHEFEKKVVDR